MKDIIKKALAEIQESMPRTKKAVELQAKVWLGEKVSRQPILLHCIMPEEECGLFPKHTYKDIHYDSEKNMEFQIPAMLEAVRGGAQAVPSSRANMGCGIYADWFGLTQEIYEDKMPWLLMHLKKDRLKEMTAGQMICGEEFKRGILHMEFLSDAFKDKGAYVYPMDLQGPVDIAHLVYGDDFFYDLYDDPDFIEHLLSLSVNAIIKGSEMCMDALPTKNEFVPHYNGLILPEKIGGVKISEDTSTLLSEASLNEIMEKTQDILKHFRGGYVHYCGKNPHLLSSVMQMENANGINFGNPEMHDMEQVLSWCAEKGKVYYGHIPKNEDETYFNYFERLLSASFKDGRFYLLLELKATQEEKEAVMLAWDKAQESVRKKAQ